MRLFSIMLFKCNDDNSHNAVRLAYSIDLSDFGFFKRNSAYEIMTFFSRSVATRSNMEDRLSVANNEYVAHLTANTNKIACIVLTDKEYPNRVALDIGRKAISEFSKQEVNWKLANRDLDIPMSELDSLLKQYQKPDEVDNLLKIQKDIDNTKEIMYKNVEDLLARGERIEDIVAKSDDLGRQSKTFVTQANKMNGCCR